MQLQPQTKTKGPATKQTNKQNKTNKQTNQTKGPATKQTNKQTNKPPRRTMLDHFMRLETGLYQVTVPLLPVLTKRRNKPASRGTRARDHTPPFKNSSWHDRPLQELSKVACPFRKEIGWANCTLEYLPPSSRAETSNLLGASAGLEEAPSDAASVKTVTLVR